MFSCGQAIAQQALKENHQQYRDLLRFSQHNMINRDGYYFSYMYCICENRSSCERGESEGGGDWNRQCMGNVKKGAFKYSVQSSLRLMLGNSQSGMVPDGTGAIRMDGWMLYKITKLDNQYFLYYKR